MTTFEYNLLYFPNEIMCEIYSHMNQNERMSLRTTCKQFYFMFKQDIPSEKVQEWRKKLINLMGISFAEKLLVYQKVKFVYQVPKMTGISWNYRNGYAKESVTYFLDSKAPVDDNFRFYFVFHAGNNISQEYKNSLESVGSFFLDDETESVCGIFKFKECPKNVFDIQNVDYLCTLMVDMFFKFISRPQYKNSDKILNYRLSQLLEDLVDRPEQTKTNLFKMFDNSVYVSIPAQEEQRAAKQAQVSQIKTSESYVYQEKANRMIEDLRRDMKSYFFDGKDGKKCMFISQ